jgi:excisionase family DNA binding protein
MLPKNLPAFLTRDEVSKLFRISTRTVDRLVVQGKLRPIKITPQRIIFSKVELEQFLQKYCR